MHISGFRTFLAGVAVAALAWTGVAAAAPVSDAVRPISDEELADGWIALYDGHSLYGWERLGVSEWTVEDGVIRVDSGAGGMLATSVGFKNAQVIMELGLGRDTRAGVAMRASLEGHPSENGSAPFTFAAGDEDRTVTLSFTKQGNSVSVSEYVDGDWQEVDSVSSADMNDRGRVALYYYGGGTLEVRSVKLRPLGMESIFNGEDLTGWKNPWPERDSEFSVIDGALNIKDGNGQIETEAVYRDFLLQMEIYSNGEHLNSGVFFRGPPEVFWRGYESQIRNQWVGDDRTRAVDYGTGGIYGRQPARKVTSSDFEWFYKTIVVDDHQMAVWLNGYMVANLLDVMPPVDNYDGKAGFVTEAGTIHLQGHDPATDLSFREMYIQSYDE